MTYQTVQVFLSRLRNEVYIIACEPFPLTQLDGFCEVLLGNFFCVMFGTKNLESDLNNSPRMFIDDVIPIGLFLIAGSQSGPLPRAQANKNSTNSRGPTKTGGRRSCEAIMFHRLPFTSKVYVGPIAL